MMVILMLVDANVNAPVIAKIRISIVRFAKKQVEI